LVYFHRDDPTRAARERRGQGTGSGTEVDNEIVGLDARGANQLRCELATAEEVLAAAAM
jgi:hypothetical protein